MARSVADTLGYRLIDEQIIARAAIEAGVSKEIVADVEKRKSLLSIILEGLTPGASSAALIPPVGPGFDQPGSDELRAVIRAVIQEVASTGEVVLVAHAASYALAARSNVLRIFVTASEETRVTRLAARLGIDEKEAAKVLKQSDAGRADYIKRFYDVASEQPTHYDIVVNTDKLTTEEAARMVIDTARGLS
jgi:Cytidylate kinase-like family